MTMTTETSTHAADNGEGLRNVSKNCRSHFTIDRSCIPTVPQNDQNDELYNLGIHIYEQEVLEKQILQQVDKVLEVQKPKQSDIGVSDGKEGNKNINKDLVGNLREHDENEFGDQNGGDKIAVSDYGSGETEMGRKIRLGEMTPFGTTVAFNSVEINCLGSVEKYFKDQIEVEKKMQCFKRKSNAPPEKIQNELLKISHCQMKKDILWPKKRKKKQNLGTKINDDISDVNKKGRKSSSEVTALNELSGSEYCPSESSNSDSDEHMTITTSKVNRKNFPKNKKLNEEENWNTDDSDWVYSDDEKCQTRKSKSATKVVDDGDIDHFLRRLSVWEKHNNREDIEAQVKTLDGGFKVPSIVWNKLFNYQKVGVQWLWELNVQRCGGILGDEMGLGKTVQVIAFLTGLSVSKLVSRHGSFRGLGPVLIVCPTTVMHQWIKELHHWWPQFRAALMHESGSYSGKRANLVQEIASKNGIVVTSFVSCIQQIESLTRYVWHYVILDEGHKIRNPDSQIANAVKQLKTPHRLILSGSPMQNNLKELWSLFDFIFPGKLGTLPVFMSEFAVPITQGGYSNATQVQVATAYKCATVLRDTITPFLLRRVKEDVKSHINLPRKNEQVLFCKLTEEQKTMYLNYLSSNEVGAILSGKYKIFVGLINLRKICNHPHLYSGGPKVFKWENADSVPEEERYGYWKKAGKMIVVETLLKIWKKQDHRVVIFTQSKQMLQILQSFVQLRGYEYLKLDGSVNIGSRQPIINKFNEDKKYFLFLSTTHVGGLGINLTGADRVIIYDPDWNPATDTQARERAWRIGQKNQVTIYRLVTSGTIEEKIYHRQIFKQFLTNKVLKDPKQRRFFKSNDLYELFTLNDVGNEMTETSALFAGSGTEVNFRSLTQKLKNKRKERKLFLESMSKKNASCVLSREKVESMKKLAKLLSEKICKSAASVSKADKEEGEGNNNNNPQLLVESESKFPGNTMLPSSKDDTVLRKKKDKELRKKKTRKMYETFDGEEVPYLLDKMEYKVFLNLKNNQREEQDDYILKKLFSKSGIQTALQHDKIMESGPADFALIEGEAEKVAKEAVRALKESRKCYFHSAENPRLLKPRFGAKYKKTVKMNSDLNHGNILNESSAMSSEELLSRMKERNRLLNNNEINIHSDKSSEHIDLLTDIRNFVSFQTDVSNVATTQEIINKFRNRLPAAASPLFRALLLEICDFHRSSDGQGIWRLRSEFRW